MNCKGYRKWIEDAVMDSLKASRRNRLRAHLAECPECRQAFEAERELFAAIDKGIAGSTEGSPSAGFANGVRMRLGSLAARESHPNSTASRERTGRLRVNPAGLRPWWRPALWSPALALAALGAVVLAVWLVDRKPHRQKPGEVHVTKAASPAEKPRPPREVARRVPREQPSQSARLRRAASGASHKSAPARDESSGQPPQLEVLVDPRQASALAELCRTMQQGADPVALNEQSAQNADPVKVKVVEAAPLSIAEIAQLRPIEPALEVQLGQ